MSGGGSTKVIIIAMMANLGIAVAKFVGAFISGSASLLAEAIHSVVDTTNQVLLLVGEKSAKKAPTEKHPLGYGRESFFWSFVVTVLLFSLGGLFAIYEGVHKMSDPEPIENATLVLGILGVGVLLEGFSFRAALKEIRATNRFGSLGTWFRKTTSAGLLVIFTEDAGALLGLFMAAACVGMAVVTGDPAWDAYGSILIGTLLVVLACFLAVEIKSLIIGEAPAKNYRPAVERILKERMPTAKLLRFLGLQLGDRDVMLSYKIHPGNETDVNSLIQDINQVEAEVRHQFPEVKWQFVEPDYTE